MPGWAGSSWYFLRYMDPKNDGAFASKEAIDYWQNVDLYVGGSEHATGHLLYVRFWTKFLKDLGYLPFDEPAKKLVNQGMIQGRSSKVYRQLTAIGYQDAPWGSDKIDNPDTVGVYISWSVYDRYFFGEQTQSDKQVLSEVLSRLSEVQRDLKPGALGYVDMGYRIEKRVDVSLVDNDRLDVESFRKSMFCEAESIFILEDERGNATLDSSTGFYKCGWEVEKMSKSKWNVVNPDDIISKYGADTLRLYEMFLGPLEDAKPWNTNGIEGTYRFLRKFWNLFHAGDAFSVSDDAPTKAELKALHATIRKVEEDIEKLSLNTSVSQFMICVNELTELKCNKRAILEPLTIVLSSFAPHICEELWEKLGHAESITFASYPRFEAAHLVEDSFSYPISFNGKTKLQLELSTSLSAAEVEAIVVAHPEVLKRLEGATPKKVIVVVKRIVNVVV
jgi:leucyl-tRNA synthetase